MAGTDWSSYNLPAIWTMLQGENACTGADRVLAWEGLADTVRAQHQRLVKAGEELAAVWSPEKNTSAAVFLGVLNGLADSMQETLTQAENTRTGLNGVVEALGQAQTTMRTLAAGRAEVSVDWVPRFIDGAEDEYDAKAQQVMREAESAIADYSKLIDAPPLYSMKGTDDGGETSYPFGGGETSTSGSGSGAQATPVAVSVPHDPVLPETDGRSSVGISGNDPSSGVGIGLSGFTTSTATGAPTTNATVGLPAGGGGTSVGSGTAGLIPGGLGVGASSAGGFGTSGLGGFGRSGGRGVGQGGRRAVSVRRGLPSGAVIGEGELGGSRSGSSSQTPMGTQGGGRGRGKDRAGLTVGGEADEQWETFQGVDPVIEPDTRLVRHDPGPGVLGFGR